MTKSQKTDQATSGSLFVFAIRRLMLYGMCDPDPAGAELIERGEKRLLVECVPDCNTTAGRRWFKLLYFIMLSLCPGAQTVILI